MKRATVAYLMNSDSGASQPSSDMFNITITIYVEYIEYIEVAVKLKQTWDHFKGAVPCAANCLHHLGVIAY